MKLQAAFIPTIAILAGVVFSGLQAGSATAPTPSCEPGAELELAARVVDITHEGNRSRVTLEVVFSSHRPLRSIRVFESRYRDIARQGTRVRSSRTRPEESQELGQLELTDGRSSTLSTSSGRSLLRVMSMAGDTTALESERPVHRLRHTVLLDRGRQHGLLFSAVTEDLEGGLQAVEAFVAVDLVPQRQPELLDGLVQFRARVLP